VNVMKSKGKLQAMLSDSDQNADQKQLGTTKLRKKDDENVSRKQ